MGRVCLGVSLQHAPSDTQRIVEGLPAPRFVFGITECVCTVKVTNLHGVAPVRVLEYQELEEKGSGWR